MLFQNDEHAEKYRSFSSKFQNVIRREFVKDIATKDVAAALYLLSSPLLAGKGMAEYVWPGQIRFSELIKKIGPWSGSEKAMVRLAAALYNSSWKIDINDVFWSLDEGNTEIALEALRIRWG